MLASVPIEGGEEATMSVRHIAPRPSALILALALAASGACSSSNATNQDAAPGTGGRGTGGSFGDGGSPGSGGAGGGGGAQSALTVTSTAFNEGETIPAENTCAGVNTSPPLSWTAGPSGTLSYAVLLTDLANSVIHWVIWDIPAAPRTLPAALPNGASLTAPAGVAGAKQAHHVPFFQAADNGYRGPCPSGALHNYQFEVHALDVATLPTVTTSSTPPDVKTQVTAHSLAHGDLTGMSTATMAGQ
jgi:Raf kinase inhibitor-like YbhB/YbcL family protein